MPRSHIILSKGTELLRVPKDNLVYVSADHNYSEVVTKDGRKRLVSMQLGEVEDAIANQLKDDGENFIRLGRSLIINIYYIYFIDVTAQKVILSDGDTTYHELTASREVLQRLKSFMDIMGDDDDEQ